VLVRGSYTVIMSDSTLQITASGTTNWVTIRTFTDNEQAFDEAMRIYRESAGTLDARLLADGDPIPVIAYTNTVAR
jgi:hypothetical protein